MEAIINYANFQEYYRHRDTTYKDYKIYSKLDLTIENLLEFRKRVGCDLILSDGNCLPRWLYRSDFAFSSYPSYSMGYFYLGSFSKEELNNLISKPECFIVIEVCNGPNYN